MFRYEDADESCSTPNQGICGEDIPAFALCVLSKVNKSGDTVDEDEYENEINIFEYNFCGNRLFFMRLDWSWRLWFHYNIVVESIDGTYILLK